MKMNHHGFSLIELLVAVFLTSIVTLAAFTLLGSSNVAYKDQNVRRKLEGNIRNAEMQLQRDLSRTGYRFPLYARNGDDVGLNKHINSNLITSDKVQSFTFHRDPNGNAFSAFTIITSILDFNGIEVDSSSSDTTLNINERLTAPLTAADVEVIPDDFTAGELSARDLSAQEFYSAITNAFRANPTVGFVLSNNAGNDWMFIEKDSSCGDCLTAPASAPSALGSTYQVTIPHVDIGDLSVELIYPVVAITYLVLPKDGDNKNMQLVRCFNKKYQNPTTNAEDLLNCQVLLERIQYFDVIPIGINHNLASNTLTGNAPVLFGDVNVSGWLNGQVDQFGDGVFGSKNFASKVYDAMKANSSIEDLRGFYYRFSAAGDSPNEQVKNAGVSEKIPYNTFTSEGYPIIHAQGTAYLNALSVDNFINTNTNHSLYD